MTEVSSAQLSEEQIQATCPPFCERTTHYNLGTPEDQLYIHDTADHDVHGIRLRVTVLTNERGEEDEPLSIAINDELVSLREARDVVNALDNALFTAALASKATREAFESDMTGHSARLGLLAEHANHQRHLRARETRKASSIDLRPAQ